MSNVRLMVIEDEEMLRLNLVDYLEDEGYRVRAFAFAGEALRYLAEQSADLAIVDLRLPDLNGNEFILEASKLHKELRYLIFTGSTEYVIPSELFELGLTQENVLFKPLHDMIALQGRIEHLLRKPIHNE